MKFPIKLIAKSYGETFKSATLEKAYLDGAIAALEFSLQHTMYGQTLPMLRAKLREKLEEAKNASPNG